MAKCIREKVGRGATIYAKFCRGNELRSANFDLAPTYCTSYTPMCSEYAKVARTNLKELTVSRTRVVSSITPTNGDFINLSIVAESLVC